MMRTTTVSTALAMGLLLALRPGAQAQTNQNTPVQDNDFIQAAAMANRAELDEARLALDNCFSDSVRSFAIRIIGDHDHAGDRLRDIARRSGAEVSWEANADQQTEFDRLQNMRGPAFDRSYIRDAVRDHKAAIELFRNEANNGTSPDLRSFAARTLPILKDHLQMLRELRMEMRQDEHIDGFDGESRLF
jgi:putative membrane protein